MKGKEKCELLKRIRLDIAEKNRIPLKIPECNHTGDCPGSCPRCESEVSYLKGQLESRRRRGFKPIVAGISAGLVTLSAASCDFSMGNTLQGDMQAVTTKGDSVYIKGGIERINEPDDTTSDIETGNIISFLETDEYVLDGDIAFPFDETTDDTEDTGDDEITSGTDEETSRAFVIAGSLPFVSEETDDF